MKHYNEVQLLEHYYLSGHSPELEGHVATCPNCSARYATLRQKLSCSAGDHRERVERKPSSFWTRQRAGVLHRISAKRTATRQPLLQSFAFATALMLAVVSMSALVVIQKPNDATESVAETNEPTTVVTETVATMGTQQLPEDPWATEELQPYGELMEWETWLSEDRKEGTS